MATTHQMSRAHVRVGMSMFAAGALIAGALMAPQTPAHAATHLAVAHGADLTIAPPRSN